MRRRGRTARRLQSDRFQFVTFVVLSNFCSAFILSQLQPSARACARVSVMRSCSLRGCLDVGAPTSSSGRAHQQRTRSRAARVLCGAAQGVRDENGAALPGPAVLSSPRSLLPRWLPTPPDLRGAPPRAWSPAALAFMGDTVWEVRAS